MKLGDLPLVLESGGLFFFFFKILFILFMRDTEREAETWAEGEAGSCREPDMGHMQGTPGSHPGLKAVPNH